MAAAFVALIFVSLVFLPVTFAVLAVIGLIILYILMDALGNRMLFKMSVRNVIRRPSTTALVLGGLMVGTAIISASLIVGDTLDNMIVGEVAKGYGDMDFSVSGSGEGNNTTGFYAFNVVAPVQDQVRNLSHVDGAEWTLWTSSGIWGERSNLSQPSVTILGMTSGTVQDFGGFIAANGSAISTLPPEGSVYVNQKLADRLDIVEGDTLILAHNETHFVKRTAILVQDDKMASLGASICTDLSSAQTLSGETGMVNSLMVSLDAQGRQDINASRNAVNTTVTSFQDLHLKIEGDRAQAITDGKSNVAMFTSLFFVFGSFSIIAGIALIINIFTMLGEERKGEMGVARAVGMQRTHLRKLFTYEGLIYAAVAAAIGTLVGLILAYGLIEAAGAIINMGSISISQYFTFTPFSLAIAYLGGFVLTLVTVYFVTRRISNMNIVRAVRNIPEPIKSRGDKGLFRLGLVLLGVGALIMVLGIQGKSRALAMSGLSCMTISAGLLLRKFVSDRIAWNIAGLATLFVWLPKGFEIFPYAGSIEMFVIAGVFMVSSLLIVVMFNSDTIVYILTKVLRVKGGYKAVLMTAISYPLRAKVRTALSIFIFGLVIFTVTTLSMMSGMLAVGIPKIIDETSGGFDVVANSHIPVDMWNQINSTSGLVEKENITSMVQLSTGVTQVTMNRTDATTGLTKEVQFKYMATGINPSLYTVGNYPLKEWNSTLYPSETDVWNAAQANSSLVIMDGTAGSSSGGFGMSFGNGQFAGTNVGDSFVLTDHQGANMTVTVIGIMKQSAFNGVFMNSDYVRNNLEVGGTNLFLIKLAGDADADKQATLIENQFRGSQVSTIAMKTVAHQAVSQIDGIFNLIKAFLALGLIIGITGLGIITIRSIHERRIEIGMMRAIGYTKRMVVANFALESAFVSVLGILMGSALGIITGYQLWETSFNTMGIDFVIAWEPILLVGVLSFLATLLCVYPAARSASRVSPAEVLRFE
jgi:putative ABC transport system permease protein